MKLGLMLAYGGKRVELPWELVRRAEALGFDSVWVSEVYGADAVTVASWILARTERIKVGTCIMQMPARTPALAAMTAMSLDQLSDGRFIAGLGASGPQVVEGWHGVPYGKPITRTREYIAIMRRIMARNEPVAFDGEHYQLPYTGADATGLGKPLKSILAPASVPIYTAAITPAGLACAGECADGVFPIWLHPERRDWVESQLARGLARRAEPLPRAQFDLAPQLPMVLGDDLDACRRPVKEFLALYIGGMGAPGKNFYADYAARCGYGETAQRIQALYLEGNKAAAVAAVPDELVDAIALVGDAGRIRERAALWRQLGEEGAIGTVLLQINQPEALELAAELWR